MQLLDSIQRKEEEEGEEKKHVKNKTLSNWKLKFNKEENRSSFRP